MKPEIIFEDNHMLVLNKPAGMLSQESEGRDSLEAHAKEYIKEKYQKKGGVYLHAIHRLDKPVSGVLVFAKTSKALSRLNAEIRERKVEKEYIALVEGLLPETEGTLQNRLFHGEHKAIITDDEHKGQIARLSYKVLKKIQKNYLVKIHLETGRYHQIRAQLAKAKCPIVGDLKYGSKEPLPGNTIALHHARFVIAHPVSKELLCFEAKKPRWAVNL